MAFRFKALALLTLAFPTSIWGKNDWNVPCTSGTCAYDNGDGVNHAYSSMIINGANTAIGDVTPAAGWKVMDCDPDWSKGSHQIRLVCAGEEKQTAHCPHLYQDGAENTVVRLPQSCGTGGFARVVNASISNDQSVPGTIKKRAQGDFSQVKTLHLDYDFSQLPASRGKLSFALSASNLKAPQSLDARMFRSYKRGRDKRFDIGSIFNQATSAVGSVATKAASAVKSEVSVVTSDVASVATSVASVVTSAAGVAASDISAIANGVNKTAKLGPINFKKSVTLIDTDIKCDTAKADGAGHLHIDVDTKLDAEASFTLEIKGAFNSLPKLDLFTLTGNINGEASATFNMQAALQGTFSTGRIQMFSKALSPLSIPGIITLGPELTIDGDLDMDIDMEADLSLKADWKFPKAQFSIPKGKGPSAAEASTEKSDNPLKLKADASVDVKGTVTAHVIPRLDFGLDIAGKIKATVFMDVDLGGVLDMDITAKTLSETGAGSATNKTTAAGDSSAGNSTKTADPGGSDSQADSKTSNTNSTSPAKGSKASDTKAKSGDSAADQGGKTTPTADSDGPTSATAIAGSTPEAPSPSATAVRRKHARAFGRHGFPPLVSRADDSNTTIAASAAGSADNSTAVAQGADTPQPNNGCIQMSGSIVINVGAEGKFLPFFDETAQDTIFTKSFPKIFSKCFGGASEKDTGSSEVSPQRRKRASKGGKSSGDKSGKSGSSNKSGSSKPGDQSSLLCPGTPLGLGSLISLL